MQKIFRKKQKKKEILYFKYNKRDQKTWFFLEKNVLKRILSQEKVIIITGFSKHTFIVKATQIKLYYLFLLKVPKKNE